MKIFSGAKVRRDDELVTAPKERPIIPTNLQVRAEPLVGPPPAAEVLASVTPHPAAVPLLPVAPIVEEPLASEKGKYWLRGVLVTVTPERVVFDLTGATKPAGISNQDSLNLALPTGQTTLHIAVASEAPPEATKPTEQREEEVSNAVQMSIDQQPGTSDNREDGGS